MELTPTASQTVGPYFHLGCTQTHFARCLVSPEAIGDRITLCCRVFDGDGKPVSDAMLELWQADSNGNYPQLEEVLKESTTRSFQGFGRLATDAEGSCRFASIKPGRVPGSSDTPQAPHINVSVFARGLLVRLATRIYFHGDPANPSDSILALVPELRRSTLMAQPDSNDPAQWNFEIHLSGERETVFFDV